MEKCAGFFWYTRYIHYSTERERDYDWLIVTFTLSTLFFDVHVEHVDALDIKLVEVRPYSVFLSKISKVRNSTLTFECAVIILQKCFLSPFFLSGLSSRLLSSSGGRGRPQSKCCLSPGIIH